MSHIDRRHVLNHSDKKKQRNEDNIHRKVKRRGRTILYTVKGRETNDVIGKMSSRTSRSLQMA